MGLKRTVEPSVEPVTLDEAKAHLRVTGSDENALITSLIAVARQAAEDYCQRSLITQRWQKTLDWFPPGAIELSRGPVQSIVSVKYRDGGGVLQTLAGTEYLLDNGIDPASLVPAYGKAWPATQAVPNAVEVLYSTGYGDAAASVPGPIKSWMLLKLAELFEHREASAERVAMPHPFVDCLLAPYRIMRF